MKYGNRVRETSTTTGTGNITLAGALQGFVSFNSEIAVGEQFAYTIENIGIVNGVPQIIEWEVGVGHLSDATTLVRETVLKSSNADGLVNFSAGTKIVFNSPTAEDAARWDSGGGAVDSVNGQTGIVVLDTDDVAEGTNQYFTSARVRAVVLTGISFLVNTAVVAGDSVLSAFGKLQAQINDIFTSLSNKQPLDQDLTDIAALTPSNDDFIQRKAGAWTYRTLLQVKTDLALNNVPNTDATNPANITQNSSYRFVSDAEKTTWNASEANAKSYADGLVVGVFKDRGNHDASTNLFPSTGGSGAGGAIKKGDAWIISVAGTLGGKDVTSGDAIRALTDTPGQTAANWAQTENNFGYVAENTVNKSADVNADQASTTKYPTVKAVYDWAVGLFVQKNAAITAGTKTKITYDTKGLVTGGADATQDDIADGTTNRSFTNTEKTKLAGIATGATANSSDATLLNRGNHTGTQTASTISDFTEAAQDAIGALVVDSATIDATYNDAGNTESLTVIPNSSIQKIEVAKNSGAVTGTRKQINLIEGANITITIVDDAANDQIDITINAASGGGGMSHGEIMTRIALGF